MQLFCRLYYICGDMSMGSTRHQSKIILLFIFHSIKRLERLAF